MVPPGSIGVVRLRYGVALARMLLLVARRGIVGKGLLLSVWSHDEDAAGSVLGASSEFRELLCQVRGFE